MSNHVTTPKHAVAPKAGLPQSAGSTTQQRPPPRAAAATPFLPDDDDDIHMPAVIVSSALRSQQRTVARKRPHSPEPRGTGGSHHTAAPSRATDAAAGSTASRTVVRPIAERPRTLAPSSLPSSQQLSQHDKAVGATPLATQQSAVDEPMTATQEAFVTDDYHIRSPPPAFDLRSPSPAIERQSILASNAPLLAKGDKATWESATKAFFNFIDSRPLAVAMK
jgi:hypothetical protein